MDLAIHKLPGILMSPNLSSSPQIAGKRLLDIIGATLLLVLLAPLMAVEALLIWATSGSPVLYRWHVIGQSGKPFVGYKFRTMVRNAEELRSKLQDRNEMTGPYFKMKDDPRVTRLGRTLRRFSLDELPQLWSIFVGDMSFVGPRPTQVFEYEQLNDQERIRNSVKPGAISLWIVSGKSPRFHQMIELDVLYISKWSLWLDLKILCKAIPYILCGKNY